MKKIPGAAFAAVLLCCTLSAQADDPTAGSDGNGLAKFTRTSNWTVGVIPYASFSTTPKFLYLTGPCLKPVDIDLSRLSIRRIDVRANELLDCAPNGTASLTVPLTGTYLPGSYSVFSTGTSRAGAPLIFGGFEVLNGAPGKPTMNITGLWYDPATTGSGVSFVQSKSGSNIVFGTWFMAGGSWYSLQQLEWNAAGDGLEGVAFEVQSKTAACPNATPCPAAAQTLVPVGSVSIKIKGPNDIYIQAFDGTHQSAFASNLTKLLF